MTGNLIRFDPRPGTAGFTIRDRMELDRWDKACCRVTFHEEDGVGAFALLQCAGRPWSRWGVAREGGRVLLWDCVSHENIGHFASMAEALAAVPTEPAVRWLPPPNVIAFERRRAVV